MLNYLIVEDFSGQAVPFLFPLRVNHEDMREQLPYGKIISGGQVWRGDHAYICGGACAIPNVKPRPQEDAALIGLCMQEKS